MTEQGAASTHLPTGKSTMTKTPSNPDIRTVLNMAESELDRMESATGTPTDKTVLLAIRAALKQQPSTPTVTITVEGGVVQDVHIESGPVHIRIMDFDTNGCDPKRLQKNEAGDSYVLSEYGPESTGPKSPADRLAAIDGLTVANCLNFFGEKATDREREIAAACHREHGREGELEFDPTNVLLSEADDNGAYVLAWRWFDFAGTKWNKEADPAKTAS